MLSMIYKIITFITLIFLIFNTFTVSTNAKNVSPNKDEIVKFDYMMGQERTIKNDKRLEIWDKNNPKNDKSEDVNKRVANVASPDCFEGANPLSLCKSKIKPLFDNQYNDSNADRINLVFIYTDTYTNTPLANRTQLQNFLQVNSTVTLPAASTNASNNFGYAFGFFSVEPLKSNKNKFNLWYYDVDKFDADSPDIIADEFQFFTEEFGLPYLTPIILNSQNTRDNAFLANYSELNNNITNYYPGYGRVISMPQNGTAITDFATLVHESGHFLFGLGDEYREPNEQDVRYKLPNCVQYNGRATLNWSNRIGQVDPFYNEVVTLLNNASYPSNKIPAQSLITTGINRNFCQSDVTEFQAVPTQASIMNEHFKMPVFGSVNREKVERVLNLFSGTTTPKPKPSTGNPTSEFNSGQLNIATLFVPSCYRTIMQGREFLECNFKTNADYGNLNQNNLISIRLYSQPNSSNGFTETQVGKKGMCDLGFNNLNCDRIDITNITNRNVKIFLDINSWFYSLNVPSISNLDDLTLINDDILFNQSVQWGDVVANKNNYGLNTGIDFNKNNVADTIFWNQNGNIEIMQGVNPSARNFVERVPTNIGFRIAGLSDFDGDGDTDVLWRNINNGLTFVWIMENNVKVRDVFLESVPDSTGYAVALFKDLDGDNVSDLTWRNLNNGHLVTWLLNSNGSKKRDIINNKLTIPSGYMISTICSNVQEKNVLGLVLRNFKTNEFLIRKLVNGVMTNSISYPNVPIDYQIKGCADVDGDDFDDIIWQQASTGLAFAWKMQLHNRVGEYMIDTVSPSSGYELYQFARFDNNKTQDLFWVNRNIGTIVVWQMNGIRSGFQFTTALNNQGFIPVKNSPTY
jgi:hypothetical protein